MNILSRHERILLQKTPGERLEESRATSSTVLRYFVSIFDELVTEQLSLLVRLELRGTISIPCHARSLPHQLLSERSVLPLIVT
jgi:hypothetical protein